MSIIYDALQKTQENLVTKYNLPAEKKFFSSHWMDIFLVAVITFLLIVVVFAYYPRIKKQLVTTPHHVAMTTQPATKPRIPQTANTVAAPTVVAQPSQNLPSPAPRKQKSNFVLNGIFLSDDEKIVLINNQPLHIGDTIDGKKVLSITADNVKLGDKGSIVTLRTTS